MEKSLKFSGSDLLLRENVQRVILAKSALLICFRGGKAILFGFFVQSIIAQAWLEPSLLHVSASVDLVFSYSLCSVCSVSVLVSDFLV